MSDSHRLTFRIREADWPQEKEILSSIRHAVFVEEQKVSADEEIDEQDPLCIHVVALVNDPLVPVGTARLQRVENGISKIGRVAVLEPWRRRGIASALLKALISIAEDRGDSLVKLHGQIRSQPFYESLGFLVHDPVFEECGISHRLMTLDLPRPV